MLLWDTLAAAGAKLSKIILQWNIIEADGMRMAV
jgi:hypothetical protein